MISEHKKRFGCKVLASYKAGDEPKTHYTTEPWSHYGSEADMPVDSAAPGVETCAGDRREFEGAHVQCLEPHGCDALRADQPRLEPERRVRRLEVARDFALCDPSGSAAGAQHAQPR